MLKRSPKMDTAETYNYAVERQIIVEVYDDFTDRSEPAEVIAFYLDGDSFSSHDDLPLMILDHLYGLDGFSVDDRRHIYECGASNAIQEIVLAIVSGLAGGLTTHLVESLKKLKKGSSAEGDPDESYSVEQFSRTIQKSYKPSGELLVLEQSASDTHFSAIIRDSSDCLFSCSLSFESGHISVKRGR